MVVASVRVLSGHSGERVRVAVSRQSGTLRARISAGKLAVKPVPRGGAVLKIHDGLHLFRGGSGRRRSRRGRGVVLALPAVSAAGAVGAIAAARGGGRVGRAGRRGQLSEVQRDGGGWRVAGEELATRFTSSCFCSFFSVFLRPID